MTIQIEANPLFEQILDDTHRYQVLYGGAGSGKSYAAAQKVVYDLIFNGAMMRYLIIRKVAKTLRHSCFSLLKSWINKWNLASFFKIRETDMYIRAVNGNEAIFVGLDDREKLKSIDTPTRIWVEEASEIDKEDLMQLNLRMRGETPVQKQIILSFNPISHLHWLKEYFFDIPKDNAFVSKTTYLNNAFIEGEYREELENFREIDQYYYQVYCLGEWGEIGNVVFKRYVIENFDYKWEDLENRRIGMDFGFNHPSTIVMVGFKDGEMYAYDELWIKEKTNPELIEEAKGFFDRQQLPQNLTITADSAEPARIREFNLHGFNIRPTRKGKESLKYGYDYIKAHRVHIHKTRCPQTAIEFQMARNREDKDGNVLDEVVDINVDCLAAIRYATEDIWAYRMPTDWPTIPH
jgi:phage terminase large subunit